MDELTPPIPNTEKKSSFLTFTSRVGEYLIFVGTAGLIIYFIFKSIFGTPSEFRVNSDLIRGTSDTVSIIHSNVDSIKGMGYFLMERYYQMEKNQKDILSNIDANTEAIQNLSKEVSSLKRITNIQVEKSNDILLMQNQMGTNMSDYFNKKYEDMDKNK